MKTKDQIIKEMDKTHLHILNEMEEHYTLLGNDNKVTAKLHWENHIRLQGYRDALAWVLENDNT